jgi:hypothetical protein
MKKKNSGEDGMENAAEKLARELYGYGNRELEERMRGDDPVDGCWDWNGRHDEEYVSSEEGEEGEI